MAQQSKKNSPGGRGQEEQLPSILATVQGTEEDSEASSGVGSPIEERQHISKCKIGFLLYPVLLTNAGLSDSSSVWGELGREVQCLVLVHG